MMTKSLPEQIQQSAQAPAQVFDKPLDWGQLVSTGSLLLDLAISSSVARYGGIPGRCIVQVYGQNSTGKTTLMADVLGAVQRAGGQYIVRDPEGRLNPGYCDTFGVKLNQSEVIRTGTITDIFETLIGPIITKTKQDQQTGKEVEVKSKRDKTKAWAPDPSRINIYAVDSLASLASRMEMDQGDKMGKKRAKDFSEGFRMVSDHIFAHNILMFCTDQVRQRDMGPEDTSGGNAIGFYSSLRIGLYKTGDITREIKVGAMAKAEKHVVGISVVAWIRKPVLNRPGYRVPLRLIYNYGWDEIGANLEWLKAHGQMEEHPTKPDVKKIGYVIGDKHFVSLEGAIRYVEENNLEQDIRDWVVDVWGEIEEQLRPKRKEKVR